MIGRSHLTKPFFAAEMLDFILILTKESRLFLCDTVVREADGRVERWVASQ